MMAKHILLGFLILLLLFNILVVLDWVEFQTPIDRYGNLLLALMLVLNHVGFNYTKTGWPSWIMKTLALVAIAGCGVYFAGVLIEGFPDLSDL